MAEPETWRWDLPPREPRQPRLYNRRQVLAATGVAIVSGIFGGGVGGYALRSKVAGRQGNDETYLKLKWKSMPVPSHTTSAEFLGDPNATNVRASWLKVGVILTESDAFQRLIANPDLDRRPAIAFYTGQDKGQVGMFASTADLGRLETDDYGLTEQYFAIGMRIGLQTLRASFGVVDPFDKFTPAAVSYAYTPFLIGQPHPKTSGVPIV